MTDTQVLSLVLSALILAAIAAGIVDQVRWHRRRRQSVRRRTADTVAEFTRRAQAARDADALRGLR